MDQHNLKLTLVIRDDHEPLAVFTLVVEPSKTKSVFSYESPTSEFLTKIVLNIRPDIFNL